MRFFLHLRNRLKMQAKVGRGSMQLVCRIGTQSRKVKVMTLQRIQIHLTILVEANQASFIRMRHSGRTIIGLLHRLGFLSKEASEIREVGLAEEEEDAVKEEEELVFHKAEEEGEK